MTQPLLLFIVSTEEEETLLSSAIAVPDMGLDALACSVLSSATVLEGKAFSAVYADRLARLSDAESGNLKDNRWLPRVRAMTRLVDVVTFVIDGPLSSHPDMVRAIAFASESGRPVLGVYDVDNRRPVDAAVLAMCDVAVSSGNPVTANQILQAILGPTVAAPPGDLTAVAAKPAVAEQSAQAEGAANVERPKIAASEAVGEGHTD